MNLRQEGKGTQGYFAAALASFLIGFFRDILERKASTWPTGISTASFRGVRSGSVPIQNIADFEKGFRPPRRVTVVFILYPSFSPSFVQMNCLPSSSIRMSYTKLPENPVRWNVDLLSKSRERILKSQLNMSCVLFGTLASKGRARDLPRFLVPDALFRF